MSEQTPPTVSFVGTEESGDGPLVAAVLARMVPVLDEISAGPTSDVEGVWVATDLASDRPQELSRLQPGFDLIVDLFPFEMSTVRVMGAEHRQAGSQHHIALTGVTDRFVLQLVFGGSAGSWDGMVARAELSDCVVVESPDTIGHVLLTAPGLPLLATLRWSDADRELRGRVSAWVGDDDAWRGKVYRAQRAAGLVCDPYVELDAVAADLDTIVTSREFVARWPDVAVPRVTADAPAGTRAVTVFADGVAVQLAVGLGRSDRYTLLHELAHVVTPDAVEAHDRTFVDALLELLVLFGGPQDAARLAFELTRELREAGETTVVSVGC